MEFFVSGKKRIGFRHIHPMLAQLLQDLPQIVDPDNLSPSAESRFYPEPMQSGEHEDLNSDWKAFVQPSLHELFRSTRDTVAADLRGIVSRKDTFELAIPVAHIDAWLNVLNQARLALAADLNFDEQALASNEPPDLLSPRGLTVFRINLYAFMQQCLIEQAG